MRIECDRGF
ncbi:hypothetical protein LSH36_143g06035 [Paralvinella palmiformis]|uniref:Uncharacterized protein n=1 Tax=Paralvinella palmiformis TaxID=53620 RepID=A0AAD9JVK3_9ANNE|nr:hypothetical protein LSH36_143g06035 [Paralvinella palmiformis]